MDSGNAIDMRTALIAAITAIMVLPLAACRTEEARYRTLSIFFDGVPPLTTALVESDTRPGIHQPMAIQFTVHQPWAERKCELCHSRMFSNELKVEKSQLCATCHEGDHAEGAFVHGPVASGQCDACHSPHRSRFPNLLYAEGEALCNTCHDDGTFSIIEMHQIETGQSCLDCHDPHSSENAYLIR